MRSDKTRVLVEIGLTMALSSALMVFAVRVPINVAGGTISLEMLPIMVLALRRGAVAGCLAGALFGLIDLAYQPYVVHPVQFFLDYPLAFGLVGLAGLGSRSFVNRVVEGEAASAAFRALGWIALAGSTRFAAHFVSGVVFFGSYAPEGQPIWLYSAVYNATYMVPSIIACAALAMVVLPAVSAAVPVPARGRTA